MPGINNVNSIYNQEIKRLSSKLTFQLGEIFAARLVNFDEKHGEILLKFLDGWQFSARLEKPLDFFPKGQLKFKVIGSEEGKLILKLLEGDAVESNEDFDILNKILEGGNSTSLEKEILEKMLRHDMSLTRENITKVKTLIDFSNKIKSEPTAIDVFISKYIVAKGISTDSEEGKSIHNKLKNFFNSLCSISEEDLLTLIENGIEINTDNIDSFKRVFKQNSGLYSSLKDLQTILAKDIQKNESTLYEKNISEQYTEDIINMEQQPKIEQKEKLLRSISYKTIDTLEIINNNVQNKSEAELSDNSDINITNEDDSGALIRTIGKENNKLVKLLLREVNNEVTQESELIKVSIREKSEEIKNIVKDIFSLKNKVDNEALSRIIDAIKPVINDIKLFNTMSNQYYYMDIPLNVKENEYNCKFIIKDERKKGKEIDSKNVTMVVSVNTVNIGVVDGFIKVRDNSMNVDIKCDKEWVSFLQQGKGKLLHKLSLLEYNLFVNFLVKESELDISCCREFFSDNSFTNINVRV